MANELIVLDPPASIIAIRDEVITAESPMTDEEFHLLNKLFVQMRSPIRDSNWVPNYYTDLANQMLEHTYAMCIKYQLPTTSGRYYVITLETGRHLQWWSEITLQRMGYVPAIGGN